MHRPCLKIELSPGVNFRCFFCDKKIHGVGYHVPDQETHLEHQDVEISENRIQSFGIWSVNPSGDQHFMLVSRSLQRDVSRCEFNLRTKSGDVLNPKIGSDYWWSKGAPFCFQVHPRRLAKAQSSGSGSTEGNGTIEASGSFEMLEMEEPVSGGDVGRSMAASM